MIIEARNARCTSEDMRVVITYFGQELTINGKSPTDLAQRAVQKVLEMEAIRKHYHAKDEKAYFKQYAKYYMKTYLIGKKSGTYVKESEGYIKNYLVPYFGKMIMAQIKTSDVQRFLDGISSVKCPGEDLCIKTKRSILVFFAAILSSAVEDGYLDHNPAKSTRLCITGKPEREVPSWSEADWCKLYNEVLPRLTLQQDRLFLLIDMFHGLRKGEIAALTWDDIDLEHETLTVRRSVQWAKSNQGSNQGQIKEPKTKNGYRTIALSRFVLPYLQAADKSKPFLIYGVTYKTGVGIKPPSLHTVEQVIKRIRDACEASGIKQKYQSHELRHTVITFDCNAGIDDKTLANNHGHYNAQFSKEKYARSLETQQQRARKISDDFMENVLYTENRVG